MTIVIEQSRSGAFVLLTKSMVGLCPAGWRLQRGVPLPIDKFEFTTLDEATTACSKLQKYVDENKREFKPKK